MRSRSTNTVLVGGAAARGVDSAAGLRRLEHGRTRLDCRHAGQGFSSDRSGGQVTEPQPVLRQDRIREFLGHLVQALHD
jgi:hypothetical protein